MNQYPRQTTAKRITLPPEAIPSRPDDTSLAASPNGASSGAPETAAPETAAPEPVAPETAPREAGRGEADDPVMRMEGVYIISVAARILDMHPQTLRKYERLGLINPGRTLGMLRLYSRDDIRRLRLIRRLSDEMGLNLAGVEFALATVENLLTLRKRLGARLNDAEAQQALDEELELLFESLNLRLDR